MYGYDPYYEPYMDPYGGMPPPPMMPEPMYPAAPRPRRRPQPPPLVAFESAPIDFYYPPSSANGGRQRSRAPPPFPPMPAAPAPPMLPPMPQPTQPYGPAPPPFVYRQPVERFGSHRPRFDEDDDVVVISKPVKKSKWREVNKKKLLPEPDYQPDDYYSGPGMERGRFGHPGQMMSRPPPAVHRRRP